jgi:hypothetical protein
MAIEIGVVTRYEARPYHSRIVIDEAFLIQEYEGIYDHQEGIQ